jgi:hypothetical protein
MKTIFAFLVLMLILGNNVLAKCTLTTSQQECLHNARMLVKHNHYPEAMQSYNKILARVHNNLALVREAEHTCRHCCRGDKHYCQTLENIAAAYNCIEYRYTALIYYKKLLKKYPNSIKYRFAIADIYFHLSRYCEAERFYRSILKISPNNRDALVSIARTYNFRGKQRLAIKTYKKLLLKWPNDTEIRRELAYAYYWAGFDEIALARLKTIPGCDARCIAKNIQQGLAPQVYLDHNQSHDKDKLDIRSTQVDIDLPINNIDRAYVYARNSTLKQLGQRISANIFMLGARSRLGTPDSKLGVIWPSVYLGMHKYGGWDTFAWRVKAKWLPADLWRVDIDARNDIIETAAAIQNKIMYRYVSGGIDFNFHPRAMLVVGGSLGKFNDNNKRERLTAKILCQIFLCPRIQIGASTLYMENSKPDLGTGYYDPKQYTENKALINASHEILGWILRAEGSYGKFRENPGTNGPIYTYEASIGRNFGKYGRISAGGGRSRSTIDNLISGGGYWRKYLFIRYHLVL